MRLHWAAGLAGALLFAGCANLTGPEPAVLMSADAAEARLAGEYIPLFLTAQQLFALIRQAVVEDAHSVEADYDADMGYPRRVSIDWDALTADDEIVYEFEVVAVE